MGTTGRHIAAPLHFRGRGTASVFVWLPEPSDATLALVGFAGLVRVRTPQRALFWEGPADAMPMLLVTANGAMVGETAAPDEGGWITVTVACQAARPIDRVELVADGEITQAWRAEGALQFAATVRLGSTMCWLIARAFVHEETQIETDRSGEPLLATGCIAFTNPIWLKRTDR